MTAYTFTTRGSKLVLTGAALAIATLWVAGCNSADRAGADQPAAFQNGFHLGSHSLKVTTSDPAAQEAFDRGLTLAYSFSHMAAEKEFRRAAQLDPRCAMAWWGVALVNGPHINFPMVPEDRAKVAWEALSNAQALAPGGSELEKDLIGALAARYTDPQPQDRRPLDEAYAAAMRGLWGKYPDQSDVGTLYAEALMDLRPWDLWTGDGQPQPGTQEVLATLERVLEINPNHPGANHLYIHAIEASPQPEKAVAAADRLRTLVPGASHMVHMPAHIYARVGRWDDAAAANTQAMEADKAFRAKFPRPGFYALYMAHNTHFYAFAAMMQGRSTEALRAAQTMVGQIPDEFLQNYRSAADGFMIFVPEVLMRFGKWEEILAYPAPGEDLPFSQAMWRFTRAVALTGLGRMQEAQAERAAFQNAVRNVPADWGFGNNTASDLLTVAGHMLDGEMAAKEGRFEEAIASLNEAVRVEDTLRYDEPPDWLQPVRHTLGIVLLRAGKYAQAEAVYRQDLARFPENGWSLFGLSRALNLQGKTDEAARVHARFKKAWKNADVKIESTCLCQPGV